MLYSEERISHLSHLIVGGIQSLEGVRLLQPEEAVVMEVQRMIVSEMKLDDQIDRWARQRLASYSKKIPEGSSEWKILYDKFFEEELRRKRRR